jgi:hypothetical protein
MKKFIARVNTYLIEKYPMVWNTRLVWMLAISLLIHGCFFIAGFLAVTNVELLHEKRVVDLFYNNGAVFFGIMITILQLVIWLVYMFKNNAFKNFYPTTRFNLFVQFVFYLLIIFSASSFYYSYVGGLKTYVEMTFEDENMQEDIKAANEAAVFFSHIIGDYTVNNTRYPEPMDSLYCATNEDFIFLEKPHLTFLNRKYQFYSLKTKTHTLGEPYTDSLYRDYVYVERTDTTGIYFFKDTVVDVSQVITSASPAYYNYSGTFYSQGDDDYQYVTYNDDYLDYNYYGMEQELDDQFRINNQQNYELLKRNNPKEIKAILQNFLTVADSYKVKRNIDANAWFDLVYHPDNFEVTALIRKREKKEEEAKELLYGEYDYDDLYIGESEKTEFDAFIERIRTDSFIETGNLYNVFENIAQVKKKNIFEGTIHVYAWLTFFLAIFIFSFRLTGLRTMLFSIISAGLLITLFSLIAALYSYTVQYETSNFEFFLSYLALAIGTIILVIPLFFLKQFNKIITGVLLNITLWGFVPYLLLIFAIVNLHQTAACEELYKNSSDFREHCFLILDYLGVTVVSIGLLLAGLLFMYLYSGIIKKWKALPEG